MFFLSVCTVIFNSLSQKKPTFGYLKNTVSPTLFDVKADTIVVYSIEMLGKTTWNNYPNAQTINLMPKNFSWNSDARKIKNYRNMSLTNRTQDCNGRDLPIDIHSEAIQSVYFKTPAYR